MTNILSNSPVYTDFTVAVNTYGPNNVFADQPGAPARWRPTTFDHAVDYLNGSLVTSFSASTPADGFKTTKVHWYQVDVSSGTPTLVQEGLIDPGPGVSTFYQSAAQDAAGNSASATWSRRSTEFVSIVCGRPRRGHAAGDDHGGHRTSGPAAARMPESFREGDYGGIVVDPGDRPVLGASTSTSAPTASTTSGRPRSPRSRSSRRSAPTIYSVNANAGDNLHFATTTPAGGPNEFVNNFYPELLLYDPNGNLVAVAAGNASDGRNSVIDFTVPDGDAGKWIIEVTAVAEHAAADPGRIRPAGHRRHAGLWPPFVVTSTHSRRRSSAPAADGHHRHLQRPGSVRVADARRAGGQRRRRHRGHRWSTPTRSTGRSIRAPTRRASTCPTSSRSAPTPWATRSWT